MFVIPSSPGEKDSGGKTDKGGDSKSEHIFQATFLFISFIIFVLSWTEVEVDFVGGAANKPCDRDDILYISIYQGRPNF